MMPIAAFEPKMSRPSDARALSSRSEPGCLLLLQGRRDHVGGEQNPIELDARTMAQALREAATAGQRDQLIHFMLEDPDATFVVHPRAAEVLFAALDGQEDAGQLGKLLHQLRLDPLTRWCVTHPRGRHDPVDLLQSSPVTQPTEVGQVGVLSDGSRIGLHYPRIDVRLPYAEGPLPPGYGPTCATAPIAIGRLPALRRTPVAAAPPEPSSVMSTPSRLSPASASTPRGSGGVGPAQGSSSGFRLPPAWGPTTAWAAQTYGDQLEVIAASAGLPGLGTIYRTRSADYLFAAPQTSLPQIRLLDQPEALPRVFLPSGWFKPRGAVAEPMQMGSTSDASEVF